MLAKDQNYSLSPPKSIGKANLVHLELPFYPMTAVVFNKAKESKIPILVKIRNLDSPFDQFDLSTFFKVDEKEEYIISTPELSEQKKPCIVVEGKSSLDLIKAINRIISTGVIKVIEANSAQHPFYTDKMVSYEKDLKTQKLIEFAIQEGFGLVENPSFCIEHIFCSTLDEQKIELKMIG